MLAGASGRPGPTVHARSSTNGRFLMTILTFFSTSLRTLSATKKMCEKAVSLDRPVKLQMQMYCGNGRLDGAMPSIRSHRVISPSISPSPTKPRSTEEPSHAQYFCPSIGQSLRYFACLRHDNLMLADLGFARRATCCLEQIISLE